MRAWVLLLRGINVGGSGKLAMTDLREILQKLGAKQVATYIQTGNAVFTGTIAPAAFEDHVESEIERQCGFRPRALVMEAEDVAAALEAFPFPEGRTHPKFANIWFCAETPTNPDLARLKSLATETERFRLDTRFFFLDAPEGIGRSKLAAAVEKALGVPATARNLNTVQKLVAMTPTINID